MCYSESKGSQQTTNKQQWYIHNTHPDIQPFNGSQALFDTCDEADKVQQAHMDFLQQQGFKVRQQVIYNDPPEATAYFITPPASEPDQRGWGQQVRRLPVVQYDRAYWELQHAISDEAFEILLALGIGPVDHPVKLVRFEVVFPPDEAPHRFAASPATMWGRPVQVRYGDAGGRSFVVQGIVERNQE